MLFIRRTFSRLSVHLSKGISPLIQACDSLEFNHPEDFNTYAQAISELIKYQRTNEAIHKLIKSHTKHTHLPVVLPESSYPDLIQYLNASLISRDMKGLDSAIHLLWHSFPDKAFPLTSITNTLVATKPLGTEENQKLWRNLVSEMVFYALPNKISPNKVREFIAHFGKYPENFLVLIKYAILTSDVARSRKLKEKLLEVNEKMQEFIDFDLEMDKKGMDYKGSLIQKYIKKNFMSGEEETRFLDLLNKVKSRIVQNGWFMSRFENEIDEEQAVRHFLKSMGPQIIEEIEDFFDNFNKKRNTSEYSEISQNEAKIIPSNPANKKIDKALEEMLQLIKDDYMIEQEYKLSEYQMDDLLIECFEYSKPKVEHFEHLEKWLENLILTKRSVDISERFMYVVISSAIRLKRNNFICFLFNNYEQITTSQINPYLLAEIIHIIAHSNSQGSYVQAAGNIIKNAENSIPLEVYELGLFTFISVPNDFLLCYVKDKNFSEAKFAYEMGLFGYTFNDKIIDEILEVLYKEKDIIGIMMLGTIKMPPTLVSKFEIFTENLRNLFEKEGIIHEYYFSSTKHYERPSKYMYPYIKYELTKIQQKLANFEKKKQKLSEIENDGENQKDEVVIV